MKLDCLYLEITRWCNLECEHCFRGDRKNEFMSFETINNTLKDIKEIKCLLLTGGEPLLAVSQMRELINVIKKKDIKVKRISIITNSTILNDNIINILRELSQISKLDLRLSYDMFHYIELDRLNIFNERQDIASIFKKEFRAREYGDYSIDEESELVLMDKGRAKSISNERLKEINKMSKSKYSISDDEMGIIINNSYINYDINNNKISGIINVDVNGNLVGYSLSFDEEDNEKNNFDANINELGLEKALINYLDYYLSGSKKLSLK